MLFLRKRPRFRLISVFSMMLLASLIVWVNVIPREHLIHLYAGRGIVQVVRGWPIPIWSEGEHLLTQKEAFAMQEEIEKTNKGFIDFYGSPIEINFRDVLLASVGYFLLLITLLVIIEIVLSKVTVATVLQSPSTSDDK